MFLFTNLVSFVLIKLTLIRNSSPLYNIYLSLCIKHVPLCKIRIKKKLNRIEHILVCYSIILANDTKVMGYLSDDVPPSEMKLTISLVDKWTRSHFTGTLLSNTDFCFLHDILGFCFSSRRLADNRTMTADDNYQTPQPARALVDGVKGPTSIDNPYIH